MASPGPERTVEEDGSGHPRIVAALLVAATLIAFLAVFSIWVNRQALNTDNLLLAVLMVLGTEALRRQTAVEFPEADFRSRDVN